MGERIHIALERISEIPSELKEGSPFKEVFSSLALFFLEFFSLEKNEEDSEEALKSLLNKKMKELEVFLYPKDALQKNPYGDFISVLIFLSLGILLEKKEAARARILELFLQLYLYSQSEFSLERGAFQDIFYSHFYDYSDDFMKERFEEEKEEPLLYRNNILFFGWMPYYGRCEYFPKSYIDSHQRDMALFFGDRFSSHLYQAYEQEEKQYLLENGESRLANLERGRKELQPSTAPIDASKALSFHPHQEKVWKSFLEKTRGARLDLEKE